MQLTYILKEKNFCLMNLMRLLALNMILFVKFGYNTLILEMLNYMFNENEEVYNYEFFICFAFLDNSVIIE